LGVTRIGLRDTMLARGKEVTIFPLKKIEMLVWASKGQG
jgi:hypothetical protein